MAVMTRKRALLALKNKRNRRKKVTRHSDKLQVRSKKCVGFAHSFKDIIKNNIKFEYLPTPTQNFVKFCFEHGIRGWLFKKQQTLGCLQAITEKQDILEKIIHRNCLRIDVGLGLEMKSILMEGIRENGLRVSYALHIPANQLFPKTENGGFDYLKIIDRIQESDIVKLSLKKSTATGLINPISLAISTPECINFFDHRYKNMQWFTTNAGHREFGSLLEFPRSLAALSEDEQNYFRELTFQNENYEKS